MRLRSRSSASSRFWCCERRSDAVARTTGPSRSSSRARCRGPSDGEPLHVEADLDARVGRVRVLTTGAAGPGEAPLELVERDDARAADPQPVHVRRLDSGQTGGVRSVGRRAATVLCAILVTGVFACATGRVQRRRRRRGDRPRADEQRPRPERHLRRTRDDPRHGAPRPDSELHRARDEQRSLRAAVHRLRARQRRRARDRRDRRRPRASRTKATPSSSPVAASARPRPVRRRLHRREPELA